MHAHLRLLEGVDDTVSARIDLTGQQINEWYVIKYLGNQKYLCRCSCGKEKAVTSSTLRSGASKSCGHAGRVYEDVKVGNTYGMLKVNRYFGDGKWECECKCGRTVIALGKYLKNGRIVSCGNHKMEDLTGKTFGYWKVIKYAGNLRWTCQCKCGTVRDVLAQALKSGRSQSCGCGGIDVAANYREKMLAKYGDISINRANNPRQPWQIELVTDKNKLRQYLIDFEAKNNRKPTITDLTRLLDTSFSPLAKLIHKFEFESLVDLYGNFSMKELDLLNYIKQIYSGEIITRNREIIKPYELDIVIPEKHIAFEFNGNYWHSELAIEDKLYHSKKTELCNKAGYRLIHIFEYEWDSNKDKIKQYISDILTQPSILYAKDTEVSLITKEQADEFIGSYHLQGIAKSSAFIGLTYKNTLVGVMTFGAPRFNSKYQYELIRLAYRSGIAVVGGTAKMFKYFIEKYKPQSIISYSDRAKFSGKTYHNIGMTYIGTSQPGYVWFDGNNRVVTRYNSMKHKLVAAGLGDDSQSEADIMISLGYYRIYDCGHNIFAWNSKGE